MLRECRRSAMSGDRGKTASGLRSTPERNVGQTSSLSVSPPHAILKRGMAGWCSWAKDQNSLLALIRGERGLMGPDTGGKLILPALLSVER
jgi:hypothetical protein